MPDATTDDAAADDAATDGQQQPQGSDIRQTIDPEIGLVGAIAIGVGTMIAAGIFVLSGLAVANVGAAAVVSFLAAAVVASFTALAYAEFASIYLESGGGYMYVANTFESADWTYIIGWSMILGYPASAAFYVASFSDWFFRFIYPVLSIPEAVPYWLAGVVVLALLVGINIKGTEETGLFQIVVTGLKLILLTLFLYGGLQAIDTQVVAQSFTENIGRLRELGLTSALVFITFFGFEAIATNAEEIEEPGRNVPRAIFISMGVVTVIYVLVVLVIVLAVNDAAFLDFLRNQADLGGLAPVEFMKENGEIAMGRAAQYYLGQFGFYVIIAGALFSMLSAANATILAGSRVKLAMARRRHLPRQFEDLHPSLNTPWKAVLLTGALILFYIVVFSIFLGSAPGQETGGGLHLGIEALAHFADFMLLGGLVAVNVALIQSRRKHPDLERGFRMPGVPWLPAFAILATLALLLNVEPSALVLGLIAEVVGVGFWMVWKTRAPSAEEMEAATPTAVAEYTAEASESDYEIVVPLANPQGVEHKMRMAIRLARQHKGEVLAVSVVTVPRQTPLPRGRAQAESRRDILRRAKRQAAKAGVPANGLIRIGHDAADAIINTVRQRGSQAVLMGWRGRPARRSDVVLHTVVDKVAAEAPCDVFVENSGTGGRAESPQRILVPVGGGPHNELAIETAGALGRETGAKVRIVRVVKPDAPERERAQNREILEEQIAEMEGAEVETALVEGTDVADTIVREAEDCDFVLLGATREGLLQRFVFGTLPETVSARLDRQTVLMVKSHQPAHSKFLNSLRNLVGR